jgi:hypothetical protein
MISFTLVIAITAFLVGVASAIFLMLVIGIRKGDRARCLPDAQNTPLDTITRTMLGARTWPSIPAARSDREEN